MDGFKFGVPVPYVVNPAYVVEPKQKTKLTKRQKKLKARKVSRQSRAYNMRKAK